MERKSEKQFVSEDGSTFTDEGESSIEDLSRIYNEDNKWRYTFKIELTEKHEAGNQNGNEENLSFVNEETSVEIDDNDFLDNVNFENYEEIEQAKENTNDN